MNKEEFWKACLGHIKGSISDQAYSTWFDGLELTSKRYSRTKMNGLLGLSVTITVTGLALPPCCT